MTDGKPLAIVAGAGPGLGQALMRRFKSGGYEAIGLSRSSQVNSDNLKIKQVDLARPEEVRLASLEIIGLHGVPKIVVHNAAQLYIRPFAETPTAAFEEIWRSTALSAVTLAQNFLQPMVRAGGGTFLVSGATASLRGGKSFSSFASAKFALRGLTQSLAREYQAAGIHVAHVILDGILDTKNSRELHSLDPSHMMKLEDVAQVYWDLAHQPQSSWTHELDLRPMSETF